MPELDERRLRALLSHGGLYLDHEEWHLPWELSDLDIDDPLLPDGWHEGFIMAADDDERLDSITRWVDHDYGGDMLKALRAAPLVVSVNEVHTGMGTSHLMDGWHRLLLARRAHLETIPAIVIHGVKTYTS